MFRRMKRIHILRAGRVRDHRGNDVVGSYNPRHHRAPLVLGHPADDASTPAHGWVAALESGSDGVHAVPEQVGSELADWVKTGRYGPVSASLYGPDHPGNPTPGKWHLRHVGFLGATPPAVKGLAPVEFAGGAADVTIEIDLADESPAPWGELARTLRRRSRGRRGRARAGNPLRAGPRCKTAGGGRSGRALQAFPSTPKHGA